MLSVIIPAYNEEKNLEENVKKYREYLKQQNYDFEILIVDDGSTDNTGKISRRLSEQFFEIKTISNGVNQGKGAAVRRGLLAGTGDYRLFLDADNATSLGHLSLVRRYLEAGCDLVIGSRNRKDALGARQARPQNVFKRLLGVLGNKAIQALLVWGVRDTQCGFKIFTAKAVYKILPKTKINGWAIDVEILALAGRFGCKVGIIPVVWVNNPDSRVKFLDYFLFLKDVLKIKYNLIAGKYD